MSEWALYDAWEQATRRTRDMSISQRPTRVAEAARFDCPKCKAASGQPCRDTSMRPTRHGLVLKRPHALRVNEARKAGY